MAVAVVAANRVVACSEGARVEGVECGLRRRQAESRCPGIVVVADDPARDARAFEPVVAAVEAFTPGVEIVRPGACAFATRGPSRYFGGDASLAAKVAEAVDAVLAGMAAGAPRCRVGVADGRLAAELAALSSRGEPVVVPGAGAGRSWPTSRSPRPRGATSTGPTCSSASGSAPWATWPPCPCRRCWPASAPRAPSPAGGPGASTSAPSPPAPHRPTWP